MEKWFKCPECRCKIRTVYCENCGDEIVINEINEFKDKQLNIVQEYFRSNKFYSFEYESIRYHAHMTMAFKNPELRELCDLTFIGGQG